MFDKRRLSQIQTIAGICNHLKIIFEMITVVGDTTVQNYHD